jgi:FkbM family methyltransferase
VIDAGVAWGTPELYDTWPNAYFHLIEALPKFEPELKNILARVTGEYHLKAVSDAPGKARIGVNDEPIAWASASLSHDGRSGEHVYDVEVVRMDDLIDPESLRGRILLKTDLQGYDLAALRGAPKILEKVEVIIAEVHIFGEANRFIDVANHLRDCGFRLYDIVGALHRPYDDALSQVDACFARETSPLFAYEGYA